MEDITQERPEEINCKFESIVLSINVIHINQIPFLISKSYHINHCQVRPLNNLKQITYCYFNWLMYASSFLLNRWNSQLIPPALSYITGMTTDLHRLYIIHTVLVYFLQIKPRAS